LEAVIQIEEQVMFRFPVDSAATGVIFTAPCTLNSQVRNPRMPRLASAFPRSRLFATTWG